MNYRQVDTQGLCKSKDGRRIAHHDRRVGNVLLIAALYTRQIVAANDDCLTLTVGRLMLQSQKNCMHLQLIDVPGRLHTRPLTTDCGRVERGDASEF